MQDTSNLLTKAERKLEKKRLREETMKQERRREKVKGLISKLVLAGLILTAGWWIYKAANTKPSGEAVADLGREHVPEGTAVEYNSNPPTSGPHYAQWEKPGIYDRVLADGRLIHSLEHGYIVVSYNCQTKSNIKNQISKIQIKNQKFLINSVFAHEEDEPHEDATESAVTINVSEWQDDPECQKLVGELKSVMEKSKAKRLILVPRPGLDTKVALTAWGRIDKINEIDSDRILRFIRAYHNKGPERTME